MADNKVTFAPQLPAPAGIELAGLYTMFYRDRDNNHLKSKNFRFHGSLKEARDRAQSHAEIMGYRLHYVQSMLVDLKKEENFHLGKVESIKAAEPETK